ncbi:MAG TPA: SpoIVB peptidase S55 domain-containing protein, partial [Candidatus Brocadiia bacterium]|nr:SpoIVB peptidase S55 domain-containing protein [Candidatus Brocadiia bacterium]
MLAWTLGLAMTVAAATQAAVEFMPVSEVKPGMKGRGLTVIRGVEPEEFQAEIIAVMPKAWPKGDVIVARLSGAGLEKTGVSQGMSGSPVYIDGKLVGAVAFTWAFLREPVAGISPIEQMMESFRPETKPQADLARAGGWDGEMPALPRLALDSDTAWLPPEPSANAPRPIATPLFMSCYDPALVAVLEPMLQRFGLRPTQGAAGGAESKDGDLRPGGLMGAELIGGDMSVVAMGTVTYRDGDRVLGFGHPLFKAGACEWPLTGGVAHFVAPSQMMSFKMASATKPVGVVQGDYAFGVAGRLGREAPTVPMKVVVSNVTRGRKEEFSYRLAQDRRLLGLLAAMASGASVSRLESDRTDFTGDIKVRVRLAGHDAAVFGDKFYSPSVAREIVGVNMLMRLLLENPWEPVAVEGVDVAVELAEERRTAQIVGMRLSSDAAHPGEKLSAFVQLRPYKGARIEEQKVDFTAPELAAAGSYVTVVACDAPTAAALAKMNAPGRFRPDNLDQMMRLL